MQNVLVDDRRIWVDLYVCILTHFHMAQISSSKVHNPFLASIPPGPTILFVVVRNGQPKNSHQVLRAETIWNRRENTEEMKISEDQTRVTVGMVWCLMFPLVVTVDWTRRGREVGVVTEIGMWIERAGGNDRHHPDI